VVILGAAARAGLIPGIAGLFAVIPGIASAGALIVCPCVWHAVAVPLMGLGLGIARGSRIAARKIGNPGAGRRLGRPCRAATALGALATVAGVVLALSAAWFAVPVGWI
jgi:hypothetical protein